MTGRLRGNQFFALPYDKNENPAVAPAEIYVTRSTPCPYGLEPIPYVRSLFFGKIQRAWQSMPHDDDSIFLMLMTLVGELDNSQR